MKSVKEVSQLSGVSVRTLHYYDEIDLLKPSVVAENGYRYYNRDAVVRLQEILLYREGQEEKEDFLKFTIIYYFSFFFWLRRCSKA